MNKIIKSLTILLAICSTVASCNLLDLTPVDRLTPDNYFKNENELRLYSDRFYNNVLPGGSNLFKEIGDNTIWTPLADEVSGQRTVPETGSECAWNWTALRQINFFLEHLDNCDDQKAVAKYRGVAKFFRAYFYFEKVKRFGDCPWIDHVPTTDDADLYKARDSREVIMTHILQDLDDAIEDLKKAKVKKDVYRVNATTVQALKSRVTLFEGTFRKYHGLADYEKYLIACAETSEALIKGGSGYSLMSGSGCYRDMFIAPNACKEYIFARDYDSKIPLDNTLYNHINTAGQGRVGLTRKFINSYLNRDGSRFTDNPAYKTMEFKDEIKNRDPRLTQTIRTDVGLNFANCITGYQVKKFIADDALNLASSAHNDLPLIRLAEVYLNYAEAKAELGTLTQEDLDMSINKLRERVGMPFLDLTAANATPDPYLSDAKTGYINVTGSNKGVILEIRRERNIEMILECQLRYFDLIRWKEGQSVTQDFEGIYIPASALNEAYDVNNDGIADICVYNTSSQPNKGAVIYIQVSNDGIKLNGADGKSGNMVIFDYLNRKWDENKDYYYPIPREDIMLTNGAIKQNPGW